MWALEGELNEESNFGISQSAQILEQQQLKKK